MTETHMTSDRPLPREFYARNTTMVARSLLGAILKCTVPDGSIISGIISETEAYGHTDDPASHAYRGMTQRNHAMFGPVGVAYVYFTYGMHYCFNVTARSTNRMGAGAVLLRGVIPLEGIDAMIKNRNNPDQRVVSDGPAKLAQAFGITKKQYGEDLTAGTQLCITGNSQYYKVRRRGITASPRVGIRSATDREWNFRLKAG